MSALNTAQRDQLATQLGLDAEGRAMLDRVLSTQAKIDRKAAEIEGMLPVRRADVLGLHVKHRISKYRLAKILGVSQTTIGNITREDADEAAEPEATG